MKNMLNYVKKYKKKKKKTESFISIEGKALGKILKYTNYRRY